MRIKLSSGPSNKEQPLFFKSHLSIPQSSSRRYDVESFIPDLMFSFFHGLLANLLHSLVLVAVFPFFSFPFMEMITSFLTRRFNATTRHCFVSSASYLCWMNPSFTSSLPPCVFSPSIYLSHHSPLFLSPPPLSLSLSLSLSDSTSLFLCPSQSPLFLSLSDSLFLFFYPFQRPPPSRSLFLLSSNSFKS